MIADSCGSKEGAKVGNTVGVVVGGWTYHARVGVEACNNELRHKEKQGDVHG